MSEYKIQINPTIGDQLYNINGDTAEEVLKHVEELAKLGPAIYDALANIKAASLASGVFASNAAVTKTAAAAAEDGPPNEVRCEHGPMNDLKGATNAKGDPYKFRYYCAAKRDDPTKCKQGKVEQ